MRIPEYVILAVGWILWFLPFVMQGWHRKATAIRDSRARWGILIQMVGYSLLWQGKFWLAPPPFWRILLSSLFLMLAALLSFTAAAALGRHLQLDAALNADHQLVQAGPYRILRHPVYASMFCLLLGTGFMIAPYLLFIGAIIIFLIGTEIRVRIEDRLLASRFGDNFRAYRQKVSAYIPLVR
jgi:protein-S-isoprenylcysteine O-methyltransferase Ste14